jgi:hypothetical protein
MSRLICSRIRFSVRRYAVSLVTAGVRFVVMFESTVWSREEEGGRDSCGFVSARGSEGGLN